MKIKHWFIPTKKNSYHPHLLKSASLFLLSLFIALTPLAYNLSNNKQDVLGYATNITVNDLLMFSNAERVKAELEPLHLNDKLNIAANSKARHMFNNNYWAHIAPDGTTPWFFITDSGYSYYIAGENLAKGFETSEGVVNGWMNSQTHKDNVLGTKYTDVGYAVVDGELLGEDLTLVVAMYGVEQNKTATSTVAPSNQNNSANISVKDEYIESVEEMNRIFIIPSIQVYESLNWGQKLSIAVIIFIASLLIVKHAVIWKVSKKGFKYIKFKSHPISQALVLVAATIATLASSIGVIL